MVFILLSILSSSIIVLTFKLFERKGIDSFQAIVFNYYTCVLAGALTLESDFILGEIVGQSWFYFSIGIGASFIFMFYLIAMTTQKNGVSVATVASKLSMVVVVCSAILLYREAITLYKVIGVLLAIIAVFFTSIKPASQTRTSSGQQHYLLLPLVLWLAGGLVDTVLVYVEEFHLPEEQYPTFLMLLFGIAGLVGSLILLVQVLTKKQQVRWQNVVAGFLLGLPNYGSTFFLLKALNLSSMEKSVVFPIISIGVVCLSSIAAYLIYSEKLSRINLLGIGLALLAIGFLSV